MLHWPGKCEYTAARSYHAADFGRWVGPTSRVVGVKVGEKSLLAYAACIVICIGLLLFLLRSHSLRSPNIQYLQHLDIDNLFPWPRSGLGFISLADLRECVWLARGLDIVIGEEVVKCGEEAGQEWPRFSQLRLPVVARSLVDTILAVPTRYTTFPSIEPVAHTGGRTLWWPSTSGLAIWIRRRNTVVASAPGHAAQTVQGTSRTKV